MARSIRVSRSPTGPTKKQLPVDQQKPPTAVDNESQESSSDESTQYETPPHTSNGSPIVTQDDSNCLFLCGFTTSEMDKYKALIKDPWTIEETLTNSVTHLVIKSIGALKTSQQLLPIYYAVLKGAWILKSSFLPILGTREKDRDGSKPLKNEDEHEFDGKETDANVKAKADFPSIQDIVRIRTFVRDLKAKDSASILGSEPFAKVSILAGRSKDSKQRREELKLVMEAGGATVVDDTVFKTWKEERKKEAEGEKPSMVVIVNGESNVSSLGLDDDTIRDLLKARSPLFYEEFITTIFMYTMSANLDDLLLQSFVFIHDNMKNVDPNGKLQARVLGNEADEDEEDEIPKESKKELKRRRSIDDEEKKKKEDMKKKTKMIKKKEEKRGRKKKIGEEIDDISPPPHATRTIELLEELVRETKRNGDLLERILNRNDTH